MSKNSTDATAQESNMIASLIDGGNDLLVKAAEQEGILSSALIAASGLGTGRAGPPGIPEIACLLASVSLAVGVHLGLGVWKLDAAKRWLFKGRQPWAATIWLPTVGLVLQTLAFLGGLTFFFDPYFTLIIRSSS